MERETKARFPSLVKICVFLSFFCLGERLLTNGKFILVLLLVSLVCFLSLLCRPISLLFDLKSYFVQTSHQIPISTPNIDTRDIQCLLIV